jgi:hypothetical protein
VTSHIYILYLVASKPYQTPIFNAYMLANETFYSALIILIFIFSDATPQLNIKVVAGIALVISIFLLVLANLVFIGYIVYKGRDNLKIAIKEAKEKRIEEEQKEKEEEEERQAKRKKEEEEFSKLPDDTKVNATIDATNTTHHANTTMTDLKNERGKANKLKGKDVDNVEEINGPYNTAKKGKPNIEENNGPYNSEKKSKTSTEPQSDAKLIKDGKGGAKGNAKKGGKLSGNEKSSGDSEPP